MLAALLLAIQLNSSDLQPASYASPAGVFELFVDPSERSGAGPSKCRLSRAGEEVWAAELPFTFQRAVVNDSGVAAGDAFSGGLRGDQPSGDFLAAIVSPAGEVLFEERIEQTASPGFHTPPDPSVIGLLLPDGELLGRVELPIFRPYFQPGLRSAWGRVTPGLVRLAADGRILRILERYEDGRWMDRPYLEVGPDGALVVTGEVRGEGFQRLSWYDAAGEHRGSLRLPRAARGEPLIHGDWAALQLYGPVLHLVDLEARALHRVSFDRPGEEQSEWTFGFSPDGAELWAFSSKTRKLYRYALPERGD